MQRCLIQYAGLFVSLLNFARKIKSETLMKFSFSFSCITICNSDCTIICWLPTFLYVQHLVLAELTGNIFPSIDESSGLENIYRKIQSTV